MLFINYSSIGLDRIGVLVSGPLSEIGDTIARMSGLSTITQILSLIKLRDIQPF